MFLRQFNRAIHARCPGVLTIAEESTSWPRVTEPVERGGLGFDYKWDMGWMHDTLRYLRRDPIDRQHHHKELNFRMMYAYNERYMLPLSHDEVVHCKGSLVAKMHGDMPARFASLRLLYAYMFGMPGKKLLFMGDEFGQLREWNHDRGLDWHLRDAPLHGGLERWLSRVTRLYREYPAMHALDHDPAGFQWLVVDDHQRSIAVFVRKPASGPVVMIALNFTPVTWSELRVGVPNPGLWTLLLRSDAPLYSGAQGMAELPATYEAAALPAHDKPLSIGLTLPPLTALVLAGPDVEDVPRDAAARRPSLRRRPSPRSPRSPSVGQAPQDGGDVALGEPAQLARADEGAGQVGHQEVVVDHDVALGRLGLRGQPGLDLALAVAGVEVGRAVDQLGLAAGRAEGRPHLVPRHRQPPGRGDDDDRAGRLDDLVEHGDVPRLEEADEPEAMIGSRSRRRSSRRRCRGR
jgi:hypothetical protein